MALLAVLGVLGTRLLVDSGADMVDTAFDRVFGPRAAWARLVALCLSMALLAGALVWMATRSRADSGLNVFLAILALGALAMAPSVQAQPEKSWRESQSRPARKADTPC
jgi:TRAP-type C4-dicarboxylate transport system permease small subunit